MQQLSSARKRPKLDHDTKSTSVIGNGSFPIEQHVDQPRNPQGIIQSEFEDALFYQKAQEETQQGTNDSHREGTSSVLSSASSDMFDMFADTVEKLSAKTAKLSNTAATTTSPTSTAAAAMPTTDAANYDDSEGYYRATIGEYIGPLGQYRVLGNIGKGVFSTVVKCIDVSVEDEANHRNLHSEQEQEQQHKVVAIKLIRSNETMAKAAQKELRILRMLSTKSQPHPVNTFCVELLEGGFDHRNHTVFVFEYMDLNLRETLHKFGRNVGIAIGAIRTYTKQLLCALRHLARHGVVHADVKPDNILVSANYGMVKLCDFGSAFLESDTDNDPTPYLVSRFYRPPEVSVIRHLVYR